MGDILISKRLHIGGLTPNITNIHIQDRFKSFGTVTEVEALQPDALGQARPFTFLTLETTPIQLKKCLNTMSGSMWRGAQLRLAEARPKYDIRLEKERDPLPELINKQNAQRRKRALRAREEGVGKEAQDMRIPSTTNCDTKKFWRVTEDDRLIRPICMRPSHPLSSTSSAGPSTGKKSDMKRTIRPVKRARRRVLDPVVWGSRYLDVASLGIIGSPRSNSKDGEWRYREIDESGQGSEGEEEQGRRIIGVWEKWVDGEMVEEIAVRSQRRPQHTEMDEEEHTIPDDVSEGSGLFGRRRQALSPQRSTSPVSVELQDEGRGSESPLFDTRKAVSASPILDSHGEMHGEELDDADEDFSDSDQDGERETGEEGEGTEEEGETASSPLFPVHSPPQATSPPLPQRSIIAAQTTQSQPQLPPPTVKRAQAVPEPLLQAVREERSRDLSLLASLLGDSDDFTPTVRSEGNGEWGGFNESDEEEVLELEHEPLRLRGGMADSEDEESEDSSGSSESSEEDSSEDSTGSESDEVEGDEEVIEEMDVDPVTETVKPKSALKAMFAPQASSGGFSLLASLNPELELDELDIPLGTTLRSSNDPEEPLEPLPPPLAKDIFDPNPTIPLFFSNPNSNPNSGSISRKGGAAKDVIQEEIGKSTWTPFSRQETDEEMKEIWDRDRGELTRDWKKRFREGRKARKRKGGGVAEFD